MKVIHVPRRDSTVVSGGDGVFIRSLAHELARLQVDWTTMPAEDLPRCRDGNLTLVTQLYQVDLAQQALEWSRERGIPFVICPLHEEVAVLACEHAMTRSAKWRAVRRVVGWELARRLYMRRFERQARASLAWQTQRRLLQQAHVVTNTRYELAHLRTWFDLPDLNAAIIPLGVYATQFYPGGAERAPSLPHHFDAPRPVVMQVGLLTLRKNQAALLRSLWREPVNILFVGRTDPYDPRYADDLKRAGARRGNVVFLEGLSLPDLRALYAAAAVHVLPSWSERPGLVTLEAAACGAPVITAKAAPAWEYLGQGVRIVDPRSEADLRSQVAASLDGRRSLDLAEKVRSQFTWSATAASFAGLFQGLSEDKAKVFA